MSDNDWRGIHVQGWAPMITVVIVISFAALGMLTCVRWLSTVLR